MINLRRHIDHWSELSDADVLHDAAELDRLALERAQIAEAMAGAEIMIALERVGIVVRTPEGWRRAPESTW